MSDFCLVAEPCQASPVTREGAFEVFREWTMVKGCNVAMRIDPFRYLRVNGQSPIISLGMKSTYPIAKVRLSETGAIAVIGSYIVRADMCSEVDGSKSITLP